jgi:hypothetical protein
MLIRAADAPTIHMDRFHGKLISVSVSFRHSPTVGKPIDMSAAFTISYFANQDLLGVVSDEEYERFKSQLLQALQEEWPDAVVSIDDDEDVYVETEGVSGQAEQDVRGRITDIVSEVVDSGQWQDEEEDFYEEEDEEPGDVEEKDDY